MLVEPELDNYEEGIVEGLVEQHGFSAEEALSIFLEYRRCIQLLDDRYPNCEHYSEIIAEYHTREDRVSADMWEAWIVDRL